MKEQQNNSGDIAEAFAQAQNKVEMSEILKELFDKGKIALISDLSKDEIRLATRIYMIAKMKNLKLWHDTLGYFMTLMISKDRKSRKEILDAISGYNRQQSLMSKFNPMNWGNRRF